jgi:hypothetical protein
MKYFFQKKKIVYFYGPAALDSSALARINPNQPHTPEVKPKSG